MKTCTTFVKHDCLLGAEASSKFIWIVFVSNHWTNFPWQTKCWSPSNDSLESFSWECRSSSSHELLDSVITQCGLWKLCLDGTRAMVRYGYGTMYVIHSPSCFMWSLTSVTVGNAYLLSIPDFDLETSIHCTAMNMEYLIRLTWPTFRSVRFLSYTRKYSLNGMRFLFIRISWDSCECWYIVIPTVRGLKSVTTE